MLLLNFSHPLTPEQQAEIQAKTGQVDLEVRHVPAQFDVAQPYDKQAQALVEECRLSGEQLQTTPLLIVPPAHSLIAVTVLAELHGRMGYFPPVVRIRQVADVLPVKYEVAEIINLQAIRDAARTRRLDNGINS